MRATLAVLSLALEEDRRVESMLVSILRVDQIVGAVFWVAAFRKAPVHT
jgi:hypothetical protein